MRTSLFFIALALLISLISCQAPIDVHVCHGVDIQNSIQATVTCNSVSHTQTIAPATCATFNGTSTKAGDMFTISTTQTGNNIPPFTSTSYALDGNSCLNTYVIVYQTLSSLRVVSPNAPGTTVTGNNVHVVVANYGSDSFQQSSNNVNYGRSLSSLNVSLPVTSGNAGNAIALGPVDDFALHDNHAQVASVDVTGPITFTSTGFAAQGIYRNNSGANIEFSVSNVNAASQITAPAGGCFYAMLFGQAGSNFDGTAYRFISAGGTVIPGIGYSFPATGNVLINNSTLGGGSTGVSSSSSSSSAPNSTNTPAPTPAPGAGFSTANVSPLLFIAIATIALIATLF